MGVASGRDTDKVRDTRLTAVKSDLVDAPYVDEFPLVLECKVLKVVEIGLRWDRQNWIGDHQISPRLNLVYTAAPRTIVRAAWGMFHQSQRLNELQVEDGVDVFFPA